MRSSQPWLGDLLPWSLYRSSIHLVYPHFTTPTHGARRHTRRQPSSEAALVVYKLTKGQELILS